MRRIAIAVGIVVLAAAATAAPAGATMPGRNGLIAYTVITGTNPNGPTTFGIYTISPSGGTPKLLISNAKQPAWSPDGSKIAFSRPSTTQTGHTDVWIASANGSGAKKVIANASQPTWSPSGRQLAYVYNFGSAFVASSTGKRPHSIANGSMLTGVDALDWGPNGLIAYTIDDEMAVNEYVKIYTVSSSGRNPTLLASNSFPGPSSSVAGFPLSWNPQGPSLATAGMTATAEQVMGNSGPLPPGAAAPVIALMSMPSGSPITYLTVQAGGAAWSPDGTALCAHSANGLEIVNPTAQTANVIVPASQSFLGASADCDWQPLAS